MMMHGGMSMWMMIPMFSFAAILIGVILLAIVAILRASAASAEPHP